MFAVGRKPKMSRLDDARMHWPDRDLVQALALDREELIGRRLLRRPIFTERLRDTPEPEIEPGSFIGRIRRLQSKQILDRAFEPDGGRMTRSDTRVLSSLAGVGEDSDVVRRFIEQRHVNIRSVAPQAEQRALTGGEQADRLLPAVFCHDHAGPRPVLLGHFDMGDAIEQGHGAIPTASRHSGSR